MKDNNRGIHTNVQRIAVSALCIVLVSVIIGCAATIKFDPGKWTKNANIDTGWDTRKQMANDLVDSKILLGKSKQDVISMLGEPDGKATDSFNYIIECEYGLDIDPVNMEYINVYFDSKGIVTDVQQTG